MFIKTSWIEQNSIQIVYYYILYILQILFLRLHPTRLEHYNFLKMSKNCLSIFKKSVVKNKIEQMGMLARILLVT
jgi:hypothetical protein